MIRKVVTWSKEALRLWALESLEGGKMLRGSTEDFLETNGGRVHA